MAEKPERKPIPATAQAALVRQMLLDDPAMTLEGIETTYPEYADGVALVLKEGSQPTKAGSGSGPMPEMRLARIL